MINPAQTMTAALVEELAALGCAVVEICEPHPGNPARNVIPVVRANLIAALTLNMDAKEWFERGFLSAYAEATVQNECISPFPLTDAVVEKAWDRRDATALTPPTDKPGDDALLGGVLEQARKDARTVASWPPEQRALYMRELKRIADLPHEDRSGEIY
jgi:hypothetical protein